MEDAIIPVTGGGKFEGKRYTLKTIEDLYNIPSDKLQDCLIDVWASIESHKSIAKLSRVQVKPLSEIEWVDDGKHDLAFRLTPPPTRPESQKALDELASQAQELDMGY